MKRAGNLLEQIAMPGNLLDAYLKARRGKTHQAEVQAFAADLDAELERLRDGLLAGRCRFDRYRWFWIHDPKLRLIHAAPFDDRVLHHAMMNVCGPYFERVQIFDSYACRKGKGPRAALYRAREFARRYPCYLKLDVRKYFHSIPRERLKELLARTFKDDRLLALFDAVIDGCPLEAGHGLPIGNLTSQYLANHFLAPLDRFLKERLRVPGYARYMDDCVLWGRRPKAGTASTAAAAGLTMPATAAVRTATTGSRAIATTTWASASCLPSAQENGRMSSIDPGDDPVPPVREESGDEVCHSCRALVARVDARVERSRQLFLFRDSQDEEPEPSRLGLRPDPVGTESQPTM